MGHSRANANDRVTRARGGLAAAGSVRGLLFTAEDNVRWVE